MSDIWEQAYQKVCRTWCAENHEGWVWAVGQGEPRSENLTPAHSISFSRAVWGSLHFSPTSSLLLSPPLSSFLLYSQSHTVRCFPLSVLPSLTLSLHFFLFHCFSGNTEGCSMWQAVALWLLIVATLIQGEWLSLVLQVRLYLNKCVFYYCASNNALFNVLSASFC